MNLEQRLERIAKILDDNKGEETETFDLTGKGYMVDGVVITTAMAEKHLNALLNFIKELKPDEQFLNVENSEEWIVADMGDILVHLMTSSAREKYHLENFLNDFKREEPETED
ncbi:MAG: ribosome silencing factor [Campylobacterales bacterium]|nr:ribosome silencing factor [Campylobacterales bacterium]